MNTFATQLSAAASTQRSLAKAPSHWLTRYYAVRALASVIWIALALTIGKAQPAAGAVLFVAYPLWDCIANYVDARRTGGLRANPTQFLNAIVSALVTVAVGVALTRDVYAATAVIGVWAGLSGILQLATGVRRWREASAQWPQILSGAQSCFAATHFVSSALHRVPGTSVASIWPYSAFGALYFALSAGVLAYKRR
jgi:uncharacterized membrane protein HdeD (DUF308 family)